MSTAQQCTEAFETLVVVDQMQRQHLLQIAQRLTPQERHALVRAGSPRWLGLPAPWQPCPGPQEATAIALASSLCSLLEPAPGYLGAYQLTHLGEAVAGIWLLHSVQARNTHGEPW
jgi:hypothetical protein